MIFLPRIAWAMGKGADLLTIALGGNDGLRSNPASEIVAAAPPPTKNTDVH